MNELPLIDLFAQLRAAGLPLGVDDYVALLSAIQAGFGLPDRASLERLCRNLWVKSAEEAALLHFHFHRVFSRTPTEPRAKGNEPQASQPPAASSGPNSDAARADPPSATGSAPAATISNQRSSLFSDELLVNAAKRDYQKIQFSRNIEYFPVTRREMKQSWRYLRRRVRFGPPTELSLEETTQAILRQGCFSGPVFVSPHVNAAELLLLIDQDGSMAPFHGLSRRLVETACRGGRLGISDVLYFHNYPEGHLYHHPTLTDAIEMGRALEPLEPARSAVLIFSDAGAARGSFNPERLTETRALIRALEGHTPRLAWLNPMPMGRWTGTTAGAIARFIPMFEFSRRGVDQAVDVLRGRSIAAMPKAASHEAAMR